MKKSCDCKTWLVNVQVTAQIQVESEEIFDGKTIYQYPDDVTSKAEDVVYSDAFQPDDVEFDEVELQHEEDCPLNPSNRITPCMQEQQRRFNDHRNDDFFVTTRHT